MLVVVWERWLRSELREAISCWEEVSWVLRVAMVSTVARCLDIVDWREDERVVIWDRRSAVREIDSASCTGRRAK